MSIDLPAPPVPSTADLRKFSFTPMYRARLFGSAFHARASDSEWRAGVTLWLKSQDQVPAGSLPDDDTELCRLAELGRDVKSWQKIRVGALHGWYRCSDGRLYNNVVAEVVNEQLGGKEEQQRKTLKARIAAAEKRLAKAEDPLSKMEIERLIQSLRQELERVLSQGKQASVTKSVTDPVTDPVTATNRERQGQGEGQGEGQGQGLNTLSGPAPRRMPSMTEPRPLPEDWQPSPEDLAGARKDRPDLDPEAIRRRTLEFVHHHAARPNGVSGNWPREWRKWVVQTRFIGDAQTPARSAKPDWN